MYDYYYSPGACSMSVHVVLNELGVEFNLHKVDLSKGEHKTEAFKKINPRQQVGCLKEGDKVMSENAAMIVYLNDKHGGDLIPQDGWERAVALQWLMFVNSSLHPAYGKAKFAENNAGDEATKAACDDIQAKWDSIEDELNRTGQPFLSGDKPGPADIYAAIVANWDFIANLPSFGEATKQMIKRVVAMPAFQSAITQEDIEYKALDYKEAA